MTGGPRRFVLLVGALAVIAAACVGGDVELEEPTISIFDDDEDEADDQDTTSTAETVTTTTTVAVSERLPDLSTDVAGAVRSTGGALMAITGNDGVNWIVHGPCGGSAEVSAVDAAVLGPQHVVLDAGHGGTDRGAVAADGLSEADLNLVIVELAADRLRAQGVSVVLTRDTDLDLETGARVAAAGAVGALAMVSVHHSDVDGVASDQPGTETWYQIDGDESRRLAGLVHEELVSALTPFAIEWQAPPEPGVKYLLNQRGADFHSILRSPAGTPTVVIEMALLSNEREAALLATEEGRQAEADALATAIVRFLVTDEEGRGFIEPIERVRTAATETDSDGCGEASPSE